jgi:hypothetical protein
VPGPTAAQEPTASPTEAGAARENDFDARRAVVEADLELREEEVERREDLLAIREERLAERQRELGLYVSQIQGLESQRAAG